MSNIGPDAEQDVLGALARHAASRPDALAFVAGEQSFSFLDVQEVTNRIARALQADGVGRDVRVACLTRLPLLGVLLALAANKIGAVCVPINWRLAQEESQYIVDHSQAQVIVVDEAFSAQFTMEARGDCMPRLRKVVCSDREAHGFPMLKAWYRAQPSQFDGEALAADQAALQIYTSGTTGRPKGAVISLRALVSTCQAVLQHWRLDERSVLATPLPAFHVGGMTLLLLTVVVGCSAVAYASFDPQAVIRSLGRDKVTHLLLESSMLMFLLQAAAIPEADHRHLELIGYGGSSINALVLQKAMQVFGCDFLQSYGLTEVTGAATFLTQDDHRVAVSEPLLLRSVGRPVGAARLRIVDPDSGRELPEGCSGEVWFESVRNFKEYWRDPVATAQAFPEGRGEKGGWLRTGDIGFLKDGFLYLNGRLKDMITTGGESIHPVEVENVLMEHPAVADCAVIGVPDKRWGEAVKACIVRNTAAVHTGEDILAWIRDRLASLECPRSIDFVHELPRNASGKVLKRVLREPYWRSQTRYMH